MGAEAAAGLKLVATKDLVDEVFRRHDYGIVCAGRLVNGAYAEFLIRIHGPVHACLGAATHMQASLTALAADSSKEMFTKEGDPDVGSK